MRDQLKSLVALSGSKSTCDALTIWQAGVEAVRPFALFEKKIHQESSRLVIDDQCEIDLAAARRLIVIGAGKASATMAEAFYERLKAACPQDRLPEIVGWINAPEGTFTSQIPGIHLCAARPAGLNFPTLEACHGTQRILELVGQARADDVVVCLLSGGGSSLLVAPQPGISLQDKQNVARLISSAGGNINQLNMVRRCLSRVKAGGLARACKAGRLICLIISDVLGDSLDVIASGPCCMKPPTAPGEALSVLQDLGLTSVNELQSVVQWLRQAERSPCLEKSDSLVENIILGNNSDAVDAAGAKAVQLGYRYFMQSAREPEGDVELVAEKACEAIELIRKSEGIDCWISGGEPTVRLPSEGSGTGGRNQHLALCVLDRLIKKNWPSGWQDRQLVFLSGGTDGEDGPTEAAGAFFDRASFDRIQETGCDSSDYLSRADSYHFFDHVGGLIRTGPTGTNVCDLRVAIGGPVE